MGTTTTTTTTYIADSQRQFIIPNETINFQSLVKLFPIVKQDKAHQFSNLEQTIRQLDFDFYTELLPKIAQWASDHEQQSKSIEPLQAGITARVIYTARQIQYILANAFFLNTISGYGNINLLHLYNSLFDNVATHRIRCLIEYFRLSSQQNEINENREICIERYSYRNELPEWSEQKVRIQVSKINIFTDRMENAKQAQGFVDFANKHIHIHRIISSATQEEVLFSCCPEAFVSILLCETLRDDEIVILRGCKRFVDYVGYLDTFRYHGHYQQENAAHIQDILVIDACFSNQFSQENIDRDLGKVWAGFVKSKCERIVTGHWGCGAFGGDFVFKFLQQICAAMALDEHLKTLDYSVYGDQNLASYFKNLLQRLEEKQKTVADIYQMMLKYSHTVNRAVSRPNFQNYVNQWLTDA